MDTSPRTFYVAGVKFRPDPAALLELVTKHHIHGCRLVGEPSNQHDKFAVKVLVMHENVLHLLGYVPKPINVDLWALRDAGYAFDACLSQISHTAPTHERYQVTVHFAKK